MSDTPVDVRFDPMTPVPDPWPAQACVRDEGGVDEVVPGFWLLAGHDVVRVGVRDSDRLSNRAPSGRDSDSIVHLDGEPHTRLRRLLSRAFTPRAMRRMDRVVEAVADRLLDDLVVTSAASDGPVDLVRELTRPLPTIVMSEVLGVPPEDRDQFVAWSDEAVSHAYLADPAPSAEAFESYVLAKVEEARHTQGETLLHFLVDERDGQGSLTDDQLHAAVRILIIAGNETTANALSTLLHQLLVDRDRWEQVRADRALVPTAVEEALRYDPPLNWVPRVAASRCPIGEHEIPEGAHVGLGVGAANRDPAVFSDPDDYRLDRPADELRQHLTFGYGEHFCLGAVLARVELTVALERILDRLPGLELDPSFTFAPKGPIMMRGVATLPVRLGTIPDTESQA